MSKCLRCGAQSEWIQGRVAKSDNADLLEINRLEELLEKETARLNFLIQWLSHNDDVQKLPVRDWVTDADARQAIDEAILLKKIV